MAAQTTDKPALVAGASGLVGSHTAREKVANGTWNPRPIADTVKDAVAWYAQTR